jgi:hypothetical protein
MSETASVWLEISKLFFAGLTAAVVTHAGTWLRETSKDKAVREREAKYLALRLAVILEQFSFSCAGLLSDNKLARRSRGHSGTQRNIIPDLKEYPMDADWKSIDATLAERTLSFVNEVNISNDNINSFHQILNDEEIIDMCNQFCGLLGVRAWDIACDLRRVNKIRLWIPETVNYDPLPLLREYRDKYKAQRSPS